MGLVRMEDRPFNSSDTRPVPQPQKYILGQSKRFGKDGVIRFLTTLP